MGMHFYGDMLTHANTLLAPPYGSRSSRFVKAILNYIELQKRKISLRKSSLLLLAQCFIVGLIFILLTVGIIITTLLLFPAVFFPSNCIIIPTIVVGGCIALMLLAITTSVILGRIQKRIFSNLSQEEMKEFLYWGRRSKASFSKIKDTLIDNSSKRYLIYLPALSVIVFCVATTALALLFFIEQTLEFIARTQLAQTHGGAKAGWIILMACLCIIGIVIFFSIWASMVFALALLKVSIDLPKDVQAEKNRQETICQRVAQEIAERAKEEQEAERLGTDVVRPRYHMYTRLSFSLRKEVKVDSIDEEGEVRKSAVTFLRTKSVFPELSVKGNRIVYFDIQYDEIAGRSSIKAHTSDPATKWDEQWESSQNTTKESPALCTIPGKISAVQKVVGFAHAEEGIALRRNHIMFHFTVQVTGKPDKHFCIVHAMPKKKCGQEHTIQIQCGNRIHKYICSTYRDSLLYPVDEFVDAFSQIVLRTPTKDESSANLLEMLRVEARCNNVSEEEANKITLPREFVGTGYPLEIRDIATAQDQPPLQQKAAVDISGTSAAQIHQPQLDPSIQHADTSSPRS